ncbi:MAG: hypothetical protein ACOC4J_03070 [Bacteroidota bacterium]
MPNCFFHVLFSVGMQESWFFQSKLKPEGVRVSGVGGHGAGWQENNDDTITGILLYPKN